MPFGYYPAALDPLDVWDLPHAVVDDPISIGRLVKDRVSRELNFFDDFNRTLEDADVWVSGGDAGAFTNTLGIMAGGPTAWRLATGNAINNDRYIHGDGVILNKSFSPFEDGCGTVIWEARLALSSAVTISAFMGLIANVIVDYAEPGVRCAHFFADPVVGPNFMCRNFLGAETETDSGIAIDALFHTFRMNWIGGESIAFYIDDALVATHVTNLPGLAMVVEFLVRTEAAAIRNMDIDFVGVELG